MAEIEFRLPQPEYEEFDWAHNEHFSGALATLEISLRALNPRMGEDGIPNSLYINGYNFSRVLPSQPMRVPEDDATVAGWRERHEPVIDAYCERLAAFDPAATAPGTWRETLEQFETDLWAVFGPVHRDTVGQVLGPSNRWIELYTERFGEDRREDALALVAGFPNASTERAAALWRASRIAADSPEVLAAIRGARLPSGETSAERAFLDAMAEVIRDFGCTTTMHLRDQPTWAEDPATPLAMIAAMATEPDDRNPHAVEAAAARRREALMAELTASETSDDEQVAEMLKIYAVARHMTPASEDHNLICDQRLIAASRAQWLRIDAFMVERGLLPEPETVFDLSLDEVIAAIEDGETVPTEVIDERRAQITAWRAISPPAKLGRHAVSEAAPRTLRGIAASAGTYEGRARVIASLPEASRLEAGDVLVCPATTPEWTPYFGIIGALVAGGGGLLTHAAVVAREFRIPAVVGAADAVTAIADGARVRVDGSTGVVTILD